MDPRQLFRVGAFYPIIDSLLTSLNVRGEAYQRVDSRFSFLAKLNDLNSAEIRSKCDALSQFYSGQFNSNDLHSECLQFKEYAAADFMESLTEKDLSKLNIIIKFRFII